MRAGLIRNAIGYDECISKRKFCCGLLFMVWYSGAVWALWLVVLGAKSKDGGWRGKKQMRRSGFARMIHDLQSKKYGAEIRI